MGIFCSLFVCFAFCFFMNFKKLAFVFEKEEEGERER